MEYKINLFCSKIQSCAKRALYASAMGAGYLDTKLDVPEAEARKIWEMSCAEGEQAQVQLFSS